MPGRQSRPYQPALHVIILSVATLFLVLATIGWWWLRSYLALGQAPIVPGEMVQVDTSQAVASVSAEPIKTKVEVVAAGLYVPWRVVFTSPNRLLVTERNGQIRAIVNGQLEDKPLLSVATTQKSESGLMGLALDPAYERNHLLYVCYTYTDSQDQDFNKVVRLEDNGNEIVAVGTIIDGILAAKYHDGCEVQFGPDGKLYITTGDATQKELAQNPSSRNGKILRLNSNGTIPTDNPIVDSPVYSLGHRNPQGLAWQPGTNQLWSTEHGPSGNDGPGGGDEINVILPGGNYGWPLVSHERSQNGLISPALVYTPAVAPASAHFYQGAMFPAWRGNLFFGALKGEGIFRVVVSSTAPAKVVSFEKLPDIKVGRIRAVTEGPDGALYFTTSNRDGRGLTQNGDDKIYRLVRE